MSTVPVQEADKNAANPIIETFAEYAIASTDGHMHRLYTHTLRQYMENDAERARTVFLKTLKPLRREKSLFRINALNLLQATGESVSSYVTKVLPLCGRHLKDPNEKVREKAADVILALCSIKTVPKWKNRAQDVKNTATAERHARRDRSESCSSCPLPRL